MQKRNPKTIKEKKFVEEYLKTGNATEAAARVYDVKTRDSARNIGAQNVAKLCISELLEKHGITNDTVIKTLAEAVRAKKFASKRTVPDWNVRLKALEIVMKLTDLEQKDEDATAGNRLTDVSEIDLNNPEDIRKAVLFHGLLKGHYEHQLKKISTLG